MKSHMAHPKSGPELKRTCEDHRDGTGDMGSDKNGAGEPLKLLGSDVWRGRKVAVF